MDCAPVATAAVSTEDVCANCGKEGSDTIKLKNCTACRLVKYCSVDCQKTHRKQHKKACKKRAAELKGEKPIVIETCGSLSAEIAGQLQQMSKHHNIRVKKRMPVEEYVDGRTDPPGLFDIAPPQQDCDVCFLPMPISRDQVDYRYCCGKYLCNGCVFATAWSVGLYKEHGCPFCRSAPITEQRDCIKLLKKQMGKGNASAFTMMGESYMFGDGVQQDDEKAKDMFLKAFELGEDSAACRHLGNLFANKNDLPKAMHWWTLGATRQVNPCINSRCNLGRSEMTSLKCPGRAVKHFKIAAEAGLEEAMKDYMEAYKQGHVAKEDLASTLRAHKKALDSMKSDQRAHAAMMMNLTPNLK